MQDEPDYYKILGADPSSSAEELRARHRQLVRELHPDRHNNDPAYVEKLTQVNSAFNELRDEFRRSAYDRRRREAAPPASSSSQGPSIKRTKPKPVNTPPPLRPINSRFTTRSSLYSMHPAARKTRKRNALFGAVLTGLLAAALLTMFFTVLSSGVQSSLFDFYNSNVNSIARHSKAYEIAAIKSQYAEIKEDYQQRMYLVQSHAQNTIGASDADVFSLQSVGDTADARALIGDVTTFQTKIADVNDQIGTLDGNRDFLAESKLEATIDTSLTDLSQTDRLLSQEALQLRRNSTDVYSMPDPEDVDPLSSSPISILMPHRLPRASTSSTRSTFLPPPAPSVQ